MYVIVVKTVFMQVVEVTGLFNTEADAIAYVFKHDRLFGVNGSYIADIREVKEPNYAN